MNDGTKRDVLEVNLMKKDIVLQGGNGAEESQVKIMKELRRKLVDEDGRVGESQDLTVNVQNKDASISLTKGTTRNTTYDVVDSVPTFKITFEEKTVISLSPTRPSALDFTLRQDPSACSSETSSSDVGSTSGMLGENEGKSPPTTDKKALTGLILHEISGVLDKMDLPYINKVRSKLKKHLENKKLHSGKINDDTLLINTCSEGRTTDGVGRSGGQCEEVSVAARSGKEERVVAERDEDTRSPIKPNETVVSRKVSSDAVAKWKRDENASSSSTAIVKKRRPKRERGDGEGGRVRDRVSFFIDRVFSAVETFGPGFHIVPRRASPAIDDVDSASSSSSSSDSSLDDDDWSVSDSDGEARSGGGEESFGPSESGAELNNDRRVLSGRINEFKTALEDKLGIPARNYPIAVYCFCFALFYLFWTVCYMSCPYRRTFYGATRNSNAWHCRVYDSFSSLGRFKSDTKTQVETYKSHRRYYHPFQPW